jgi:hypothetical protein
LLVILLLPILTPVYKQLLVFSKQRNLLQSKYGTEVLNQAANGATTDSVNF